MKTYIIKKLFIAIGTVLGVFHLVFFFIHLIPGDPSSAIAGPGASPESIREIRRSLHLDDPLHVQYGYFWQDVFNGSFGHTFKDGSEVIGHIKSRYPFTMTLAALSMIVAFILAIPLGVLAAWKKNTAIDHSAMFVSLLGISMPNFWLGPVLLLVFFYWLEVLPGPFMGGSFEELSFKDLILPAITLGTALAAILSRITRAGMIDSLQEDYIRTARAKGLSEGKIIFKHALRNSMLPTISIAGIQFGALLTGAIITEKIFNIPGIGRLMIESIMAREYPVVQACILFIATAYVLVNLLTDLLYAWLDPRIKLG